MNVYYSKADSHWKDLETILDAAARENAPVKVNKIDIDDDTGYWQLAAAEQELHIVPPGDLTAVIGNVVLTSKDTRRDVERCFAGVLKRLRNPNDGKGRLAPDVAKFAAEAFGQDAKLEPSPDDAAANSRYYPITKEGKRIGWVVDAFRQITCPTCNDTQFLLAASLPEVKIIRIRPEREMERFATPLDEKETNTFVSQFKGRTPQTTPATVDAVTGATKTSILYGSAVKESLAEIQRREKP